MNIKKQTQIGAGVLVGTLAIAMLVAGIGINQIRIGGALDMRNKLMDGLVSPRLSVMESRFKVSVLTLKYSEGLNNA